MSRGIFGDNCVLMAKERLCSQGENAPKASELGNLTEIAYCEEGENIQYV